MTETPGLFLRKKNFQGPPLKKIGDLIKKQEFFKGPTDRKSCHNGSPKKILDPI